MYCCLNNYVRYLWGDGFYVGDYSVDTVLCRVKAEKSRRNGLSVTWASRTLVMDSEFFSSDGTAPMAGIDVEPNAAEYVTSIRITGCKMYNNSKHGLTQWNPNDAYVDGMEIDHNSMYDNGMDGLYCCLNNDYLLHDNDIHDNVRYGIRLDSVVNADVYNNVVINNDRQGIVCMPDDPCTNNIFNNTEYGNGPL